MLIYLDLCCFNRPYDDQTQLRIRLETEAKLALQDKVRTGACRLLWSAVLDLEIRKTLTLSTCRRLLSGVAWPPITSWRDPR